MTINALLGQLDNVRQRGAGKWSALCPAHPDKTPSLSISEGEKGVLIKCWAGCYLSEICSALGILQRDLFYDADLPRGQRPVPGPSRITRVALAFRFELAAFDRRVRANKILEHAKGLNVSSVTETDLDCALRHVGQAYRDRERAELLEAVADTLRERAFTERSSHERTTRAA